MARLYIIGAGTPTPTPARFGSAYVLEIEGEDHERAREYLERVIEEFGNSNSSAVRLARDFLDENY